MHRHPTYVSTLSLHDALPIWVIEIKPHRWGWKAFEAPGVEPVFPKKDQAVDYAQSRACFRSGEVRIFDSTGNVECVIPFEDRKSTRLNSSHGSISYAVFCLKK